MTNTKDIILKIKEVREEKGLSYGEILDMIEENGDYLSKSTLSRVFAEGSEDMAFKYDEIIRPLADALLDVDHIKEGDNKDVRAMKTFLKYKNQRIMDLEAEIENLKAQYDKDMLKQHQKNDKERERSRNSIDFLKNQILLKDQRMDVFIEAISAKERLNHDLLAHILNCPRRSDCHLCDAPKKDEKENGAQDKKLEE